jgi:hypothetical protein
MWGSASREHDPKWATDRLNQPPPIGPGRGRPGDRTILAESRSPSYWSVTSLHGLQGARRETAAPVELTRTLTVTLTRICRQKPPGGIPPRGLASPGERTYVGGCRSDEEDRPMGEGTCALARTISQGMERDPSPGEGNL